ncbi:hypothetical protein, partial [Erwinia sp. B116]|uniref:hypothetical protein n=1 Tax=Erwinia sp. B116 TaxID=1561024 RepID=UPI0018EC8B08
NFNAGSWAAMLGVGAAIGAITGGVGVAASTISSTAGAIALEAGIGAVDGFVSNGVTNVINGHNFTEGGAASAVLGGVFGAFAGATGRWNSFNNGRLLRAGAADAANGQPVGVVGTGRIGGFPGHSVAGVSAPGGGQWSHVQGALQGGSGGSSALLSGSGPATARGFANFNPQGVAYAHVVPGLNHQAAINFMAGGLGARGPYNIITNSCTTWAREVVRAAGLEPPLWAISPDSLQWFMRLSGGRSL